MAVVPALRLLFPTDFSPVCVEAGRAIAALVEDRRLDVTTVHVVAPGAPVLPARRALEGFRRDTFGHSHTAGAVLEAVDAAAALATVAERQSFDLILSPSSGRRGWRRILTPSFRGQLLTQTPVPLWTGGSTQALGRMGHRPRNVACLVHWDQAVAERVRTAAAFAARAGARLHLIDIVPTVDEGTLADALHSDRPLSTAVSVKRMQNLVVAPAHTETHAAVGRHATELRRLIEACRADVLFVGAEHARSGVLRHRLARHLDGLACPVICDRVDPTVARRREFEAPAYLPVQAAWVADRCLARGRAASC